MFVRVCLALCTTKSCSQRATVRRTPHASSVVAHARYPRASRKPRPGAANMRGCWHCGVPRDLCSNCSCLTAFVQAGLRSSAESSVATAGEVRPDYARHWKKTRKLARSVIPTCRTVVHARLSYHFLHAWPHARVWAVSESSPALGHDRGCFDRTCTHVHAIVLASALVRSCSCHSFLISLCDWVALVLLGLFCLCIVVPPRAGRKGVSMGRSAREMLIILKPIGMPLRATDARSEARVQCWPLVTCNVTFWSLSRRPDRAGERLRSSVLSVWRAWHHAQRHAWETLARALPPKVPAPVEVVLLPVQGCVTLKHRTRDDAHDAHRA